MPSASHCSPSQKSGGAFDCVALGGSGVGVLSSTRAAGLGASARLRRLRAAAAGGGAQRRRRRGSAASGCAGRAGSAAAATTSAGRAGRVRARRRRCDAPRRGAARMHCTATADGQHAPRALRGRAAAAADAAGAAARTAPHCIAPATRPRAQLLGSARPAGDAPHTPDGGGRRCAQFSSNLRVLSLSFSQIPPVLISRPHHDAAGASSSCARWSAMKAWKGAGASSRKRCGVAHACGGGVSQRSVNGPSLCTSQAATCSRR